MFADEIRKKAEDAPGNVIAGMIDRLDNIDVKRERGTELEPRTATKEDIDELFKV